MKRKLNFVAVYDEKKNRIVSAPKTKNPIRHIFLTMLFAIMVFIVSAFSRLGVKAAIGSVFDPYPGWGTALDTLVAALILVIGFVDVAPRLGMFPGIRGGKLELTEGKTDNKLKELVKKNPYRLNVDWFQDWAEGSTAQREKMYQEMKDALKTSAKTEQR